jgi:hypothetical protein
VVEIEDSEMVDLSSLEKEHDEEEAREKAKKVPFDGAIGKEADEKAAARLSEDGWAFDESREEFEGIGGHWKSPISVPAIDMVEAVRRSMEALQIPFTRKSRTKMYSAMYIIAPLPKTAYVYRFVAQGAGPAADEDDFIIDIYDMMLTHAGNIGMMEIDNLTKKNKQTVRKVLLGAVGTLPRLPWDFPLSIKWRHGLLIPEYGRAKRSWRDLGFDVKNKERYGKGRK